MMSITECSDLNGDALRYIIGLDICNQNDGVHNINCIYSEMKY